MKYHDGAQGPYFQAKQTKLGGLSDANLDDCII